VVAYAPDSFGVATRIAGLGIADVVVRFGRSLNSSWNREPGDDSDDQGKGSDHDDRPQRDPDCEWHAPISLHVRSGQTRGGFLYHTENLAALAERRPARRTALRASTGERRLASRAERGRASTDKPGKGRKFPHPVMAITAGAPRVS
jgi:hypothetical protein